MAKRPAQLIAARERRRTRDLKAQVRDLNAALTDCMQHKVDLEVELREGHQREDRQHEKIAALTEHLAMVDRKADDMAAVINTQATEISTLKRTVRTVAAFAAREPGVDIRPARSSFARDLAISGENRLLHSHAVDSAALTL